MHPARAQRVERRHDQEDVRREAGHQRDDVDQHGAQQQIDRMEARRGNPLDVLRGMVHGVVLPQPRLMEEPVRPVEQELGAQQIDHELQPERQARDRTVAEFEERDEALLGVDAEQIDRQQHREADAAIAREHRHDEPVAKIGDETALLPPWRARIARRERGQRGEGHTHDRHVGQHAQDRVREAVDDVGGQGTDHEDDPCEVPGRLAVIPCAILSMRRAAQCFPRACGATLSLRHAQIGDLLADGVERGDDRAGGREVEILARIRGAILQDR